MFRLVALLAVALHVTRMDSVLAAKQQIQLSDSYLPVAMQIIAHLTDQMAFESKDDPAPTAKPTTKPTPKPTTSWQKPSTLSDPIIKPQRPTQAWPKPTQSKPTQIWSKPTTQSWSKPTNSWPKPTSKPTTWWSDRTTSKPYVIVYPGGPRSTGGWHMSYGSLMRDTTTPFHRPGLYAPVSPPKPSDRHKASPKSGFVLLPFDHNSQYTVIEPQGKRAEEPLLSAEDEEVKPLIEPSKEEHLLPPSFQVDDLARRNTEEENLQYLSDNVRELIRMAEDPDDDRVVDVWEGVRAGNQEVVPKGKLSSSNLRLLLLYDLLSREAKRQRLSDYSGFSPDVMQTLVESSAGGARAQLRMALDKMVENKDCEHEYANNRAKEMVVELAKDESKLSSELRYLQPLVYKF